MLCKISAVANLIKYKSSLIPGQFVKYGTFRRPIGTKARVSRGLCKIRAVANLIKYKSSLIPGQFVKYGIFRRAIGTKARVSRGAL